MMDVFGIGEERVEEKNSSKKTLLLQIEQKISKKDGPGLSLLIPFRFKIVSIEPYIKLALQIRFY